jgi:hypothetical protein
VSTRGNGFRPITLRTKLSQPRPPPACPAPDAATRIAERLPVCSPAPPFGDAGSLLAGSSASLSRPEPASDDDLLLPGYGCPFPGHHNRIKAPGLPLPSGACPSRKPLTSRSSAPGGLHPHGVGITTASPHLRSGPALPAAPPVSTPRRGHYIRSGSKRSTRFAAGKLTFRIRPITLRSPPPFY